MRNQPRNLQAPISQTKFCVLYLKAGRECQSPWFYTRERATRALQILRDRFGQGNAILFRD